MIVSGVDSVRVRVHPYEREFPAKPVRRCDGCNEPRTQWTSKGGALDSGIGMALSGRTIATCMWGVSDPLRAGRGAKKGAARWGSLTPRLSLCAAATVAPTGDRRHRAPPASGPKSQTGKNMNAYLLASGEHPALSEPGLLHQPPGTVLPSFGSPTPFPPSQVQTRATREREGGCVKLPPRGAAADHATGGEAALHAGPSLID